MFFYDVSVVAKAIWEIWHPNKINYVTFGDLVPHVHVVPKYAGGLDWGIPFNDNPTERYLKQFRIRASNRTTRRKNQ